MIPQSEEYNEYLDRIARFLKMRYEKNLPLNCDFSESF